MGPTIRRHKAVKFDPISLEVITQIEDPHGARQFPVQVYLVKEIPAMVL